MIFINVCIYNGWVLIKNINTIYFHPMKLII